MLQRSAPNKWQSMINTPFRTFAKGTRHQDTGAVKLRGKLLKGRNSDLPTMIWLPELIEPAANFETFFNRPDNRIMDFRNVWLLDYRNQGDSDHHPSYSLEDMSDDIVRFMNENKITMATIGGHGFGAKVAAATAINHMERFTGVVQLEGGPLDHRYHEAYQELASYIEVCAKINLSGMDASAITRAIEQGVACKKWASIFKQALNTEGTPSWTFNLSDLYANTRKSMPDVAIWSDHYGLWPGQTFVRFAAHSRWVHLSTNTLPFYNVFPRLDGQFPGNINIHAESLEGPMTHWMHEQPNGDTWALSQQMARWLRW